MPPSLAAMREINKKVHAPTQRITPARTSQTGLDTYNNDREQLTPTSSYSRGIDDTDDNTSVSGSSNRSDTDLQADMFAGLVNSVIMLGECLDFDSVYTKNDVSSMELKLAERNQELAEMEEGFVKMQVELAETKEELAEMRDKLARKGHRSRPGIGRKK